MKTVIFDFDGTLADSFSLTLEIAYELTEIPRLSDQEIARLRRLTLLKAVRELHIPLRRLPRLLLHGSQKMHERIHEVHPFPGISELVSGLHNSGAYKLLVISSNSEQNVRSFLRANNLEDLFDGVHGGVGFFDKAAALRKVLRKNALKRDNCYYVGDEERDLIAAKRVGVRSVGVSWGYQDALALAVHKPNALVRTPAELLELFKTGKV